MPRPLNRLTARFVQTAPAGYHADGGGLYLCVTVDGTASWMFRYTLRRRKREMGIGSARDFSLAQARERAAEQRRVLADGRDPIEERKAALSVKPRTWGEAKADFIASKRSEWKSTQRAGPDEVGAQEAQWIQSLKDYGPPDDKPVLQVDTDIVLAGLLRIWRLGGKVETATRVRGRIERILDAEAVRREDRAYSNPARWRGHLEHLLPTPGKIAKVTHHPSMPYADVPALMVRLKARSALVRSALIFTILTAARTDEVIGMRWAEVDLEAGLWIVPAERMKGGREHVVPLVPEAVAVLSALQGAREPFPLSDAAMLAFLQNDPPKGLGQPFTVHGFRASFRTWIDEATKFHKDMAEMALAHKISDETEAAYRRGALLLKRRRMMEAWAAFLMKPRGNVVVNLADERDRRVVGEN